MAKISEGRRALEDNQYLRMEVAVLKKELRDARKRIKDLEAAAAATEE